MSELNARDLRSEARPFKRDKDSSSKWINGARPLLSTKKSCLGDIVSIVEDENVRPVTSRELLPKARPNKTPKFRYQRSGHERNIGRISRKVDAVLESHDQASLPTLDPATPSFVWAESAESGILYSFDKELKSPSEDGREVVLDQLVERAEKKWEIVQIDAIVKEYEVLDKEGATLRLGSKRGKGRASEEQDRTNDERLEDERNRNEGFEVV